MKKFMFGLDTENPGASAKKLLDLGYDGVVLGENENALLQAKEAGLETWLCYGAHGIGTFDQKTHGAKNPFGEGAPWFGSACPNDEEVRKYNQDRAFSLAKKTGVTGIFVDGARFASFASEEGTDSFFGCFCENCMTKMVWQGLDAPKIRDGIGMLLRYLKGGEGDIPVMRDAIEGWLDFRAACVKEYMDSFARRAHESGLQAAAFVFAPSLWWFVGQRPGTCNSLDLLSPMLYRAYPHSSGPACLNHEWAAFMGLLSGREDHSASDLASLLFDMAFISDDPMAGLSPEHVALETQAARAMTAKNVRLLPILQTEDAELEKTAALTLEAGADGYGEFMYSQKTF